MKNSRTNAEREHPSAYAFLSGQVASANDCTGIAVTPPTDEEAAESIAELSANAGRSPLELIDKQTKA